MDIHDFQLYCEKKSGSELCFPFGEDHMVFKVGGKIFALAPMVPFERINLKCDPERALELRGMYASIIPGWHMNKKHWNSILLDGTLSDKIIYDLIDHSYDLVSKKVKL
ncbi:MAG: MmcQ/YjbR family DNA-binding protein [Bacteroidota bacterium]